MSIAENVNKLLLEVAELSSDVLVVAASKMRITSEILEARDAGILVFAENRVQEFVDKVDNTPVNWHFIGKLQTNKVKFVVGKVDVIHSCDSLKLAEKINQVAKDRRVVQKILLEINIANEESKGGISKENFDNLYFQCENMENIQVVGIMSVLPKNSNIELYLQLKKIYDRIKLENKNVQYLSMGMSNDYQTAIACGANVIRVGTKIFGARSY